MRLTSFPRTRYIENTLVFQLGQLGVTHPIVIMLGVTHPIVIMKLFEMDRPVMLTARRCREYLYGRRAVESPEHGRAVWPRYVNHTFS